MPFIFLSAPCQSSYLGVVCYVGTAKIDKLIDIYTK